MKDIFEIIKNCPYNKVDINFEQDNDDVFKKVKVLNHYGVISIVNTHYTSFTISKTNLFDDIVYNFDSNFDKWLSNKKEIELLKINEIKANISASKSAKSSKIASWVSTSIAAIATLFTIFQYLKSNEISEKYDKAIIHIDSLKQDLKEMKVHKQGLVDSSKTQQKR